MISFFGIQRVKKATLTIT